MIKILKNAKKCPKCNCIFSYDWKDTKEEVNYTKDWLGIFDKNCGSIHFIYHTITCPRCEKKMMTW